MCVSQLALMKRRRHSWTKKDAMSPRLLSMASQWCVRMLVTQQSHNLGHSPRQVFHGCWGVYTFLVPQCHSWNSLTSLSLNVRKIILVSHSIYATLHGLATVNRRTPPTSSTGRRLSRRWSIAWIFYFSFADGLYLLYIYNICKNNFSLATCRYNVCTPAWAHSIHIHWKSIYLEMSCMYMRILHKCHMQVRKEDTA